MKDVDQTPHLCLVAFRLADPWAAFWTCPLGRVLSRYQVGLGIRRFPLPDGLDENLSDRVQESVR